MDHLEYLTNDIQVKRYLHIIWNCERLEELLSLKTHHLNLAKFSNKNYKFGFITKAEHDYQWILFRKIDKQVKELSAYIGNL